MVDRIPWIERRFDFNFPAGLYPEVLERLRGAPARLEEMVRALPRETLTSREAGPWSIQENVGHVLDLEPLWFGRFEDYDSGLDTLRPADMSNRKTHAAGHNDQPIAAILAAFRQARLKMVAHLDRLDAERFGQTALHPRLEQPMRIVDLMYFIAEHDDYHLARITQLTRRFNT